MLIRRESPKRRRLFFAPVDTEATFTIVRKSALWYWFGVGSGIAAVAVFVSVSAWANYHSGILRRSQILSPACDFVEKCDSRHVLHFQRVRRLSRTAAFELSPDGEVHPQTLFSTSSNRARMVRREAPTYSDDNVACWAPSGASSWLWSSNSNFLS